MDAIAFLEERETTAADFLEQKSHGGTGAMDTIKNVGRVYPVLETVANLITQTYGLPLSGLAGLAALPFGLEAAQKTQEKVGKALIYEPQTEKGRELTETTFYPIEQLEEKAAAPVGKYLEEKFGPEVGAAGHTAVMGAPMALPFARKAIKKKGAVTERPTKQALPPTPESQYLKAKFAERFLEEGAVEKPIKIPDVPQAAKTTTLHGGVPLYELGQLWTKSVGEPVWDQFVMKTVPKALEKVPGGKSINRALLYDYRGDLPNTAKYLASMEDMKRAQAVGREYAVDLGRRLQSVDEPSQLKLGEYIRGEVEKLPDHLKPLGDEAKLVMLDLGKQAVDVGLLSEKAFFKNAGRYMPRLYTSKEYQNLLTKYNLTKPNRLDLTRFKRRKDIPKEIREEMGEILTPGYPVAKGIMQLTHDIELGRFFRDISSNEQWARMKASTEAIPEGWKQLPSNKKLGKLSEAHVHPEIFADLQEAVRVMETPEKVWRKALGAWKFGKVIMSPKTHARNLMSNSVLAHLGGLPMYEQPIYLPKAVKAMKQKGDYWRMAREEGGLQHTFTSGELGVLFDQVERQMGGVKAGSLPEQFGLLGDSWAGAKKGLKKAADLYEAEEQLFKMAKFIHNIERKKMSPKAAWADAEKWLFNYSKVTRFQEKYRSKWYGAPFATFTMKALPRIAEAGVKTPWRFAVPMGIIYGLEKVAAYKIGDTPEEQKAKKALRPEWMQGKFLGSPNFARVPLIDEHGREYWLNLTYIMPWGDIGESGGFGPIPGGIMPMSQPFVREPMQQILNYDAFWEEPIVKEETSAGLKGFERTKVQAKERLTHAAQAMLPTPVFDVTKAIDALQHRPDYKGRFRSPKAVGFDIIGGIKMYPVDYVDETMKRISKLDPETGQLARKIHSQIRTYAIKEQALQKKGIETDHYKKLIEQKIEQLRGLAEETKEVGELYKQLTADDFLEAK